MKNRSTNFGLIFSAAALTMAGCGGAGQPPREENPFLRYAFVNISNVSGTSELGLVADVDQDGTADFIARYGAGTDSDNSMLFRREGYNQDHPPHYVTPRTKIMSTHLQRTANGALGNQRVLRNNIRGNRN